MVAAIWPSLLVRKSQTRPGRQGPADFRHGRGANHRRSRLRGPASACRKRL